MQVTALLLQARAQVHLLVASQLSAVVAVEQAALQAQKLMVHPAEDQDTTVQTPVAAPVLQETEHRVREAAVGIPPGSVMEPVAVAVALVALALTQPNCIKAPGVE